MQVLTDESAEDTEAFDGSCGFGVVAATVNLVARRDFRVASVEGNELAVVEFVHARLAMAAGGAERR